MLQNSVDKSKLGDKDKSDALYTNSFETLVNKGLERVLAIEWNWFFLSSSGGRTSNTQPHLFCVRLGTTIIVLSS